MGNVYMNRRMAQRTAPPRTALPAAPMRGSVPNSVFPGVMNGSMGTESLEQAMRDKMSARFGPDYRNQQAEAEADRIGSRFSDATGVEDLKAKMGSALGADFSGVRFHTGAQASAMAAASQADAFATGRDIYLGTNGFDAATAAHEMVHTVQQGAVHASAPVMSAPAGVVQYSLRKKHREALADIVNHKKEFDQMSRKDRAKWAIKNPLAWLRSKTDEGQDTGTAIKKKKDKEAEQSQRLANYWQEKNVDFGDASLDQKPQLKGYEPGKKMRGLEKGANVVGKLTGDFGLDTGLSVPGTSSDIIGTVDAGMQLGDLASLAKNGRSLIGMKASVVKQMGDLAEKNDLTRSLKGIGSTGTAVTGGLAGTAAFLGDTASLVSDSMAAHKERKQGNIGGSVAAAANATADTIAMGGDIASTVGAMPGMGVAAVVGSGMNTVAQTIKAGSSFGSAIGNGITQHKLRKRGEGLAKVNQEEKAKLDTELAAEMKTERQKIIDSKPNPKTKKEKEELQQELAALDAKKAAKEEELKKYQTTRERAVKQGQKAARIRRNENIVSGVSSSVRATGSLAATGLGATELAFTGGLWAPTGALANAAANGAGTAVDLIGKGITRKQKRKLRKEVVNDEIDLDNKIKALRGEDDNNPLYDALGLKKAEAQKMSKGQAKRVILQSMGYKSGKRKEVFNQITKRRAAALTERANAGSKTEEGIMKDMFLSKVKLDGQKEEYSSQAVAEKLGLEDYEYKERPDNPFQATLDQRKKDEEEEKQKAQEKQKKKDEAKRLKEEKKKQKEEEKKKKLAAKQALKAQKVQKPSK